MKTLNWYVTKNLLIVFFAALIVMSFIMMAGQLIKMLDLLSSGIKFSSFAKIFIYVLPETMAFSLPIALLVAVILTFSRMSAENEVTALRATGVSLWQITAPGLILSLVLSFACLYFQLYLKPNCKYYLSNAKQSLLLDNPSMIIVPGSTVKIGKISLTIGEKDGKKLKKINIVSPSSKNEIVTFYGMSGELEIDSENNIYNLHMEDVKTRKVTYSPEGEVRTVNLTEKKLKFPLDVGKLINDKKLTKRAKYLDYNGLVGRIQVMGERKDQKEENELLFQLNQAIVLALSPFAFLIVAMPFGFNSTRSETSRGLVLSLLVVVVYFTIVLLMKNFDKASIAHKMIWIPNILFTAYGVWAMQRITKT